ncbi:SUKH-3 domain-containing protein [Kitasatospora sp. NPDC059571]|uniref:SUKH-3 domain-containing protein n=1 Tax=Kitasatospora sp. NPDC059571 TaxID=3346871 RepID=UPI0036BDBFA1
MNGNDDRPALRALRADLSGTAEIELHPLDLAAACRQYEDDGYQVTPRLREFLAAYGEATVTWRGRVSEVEVTTSVERTLESTHAFPRSIGIFAHRLGQGVTLIGTAFETEECLLLADDGDILLYGDGGFQRVAHGFENAIRALVSGDWDKALFSGSP